MILITSPATIQTDILEISATSNFIESNLLPGPIEHIIRAFTLLHFSTNASFPKLYLLHQQHSHCEKSKQFFFSDL